MRLYIMERFVTRTEMVEQLKDAKQVLEIFNYSENYNSETSGILTDIVVENARRLAQYPNGRWVETEGKKDLDHFKEVCVDRILRDKASKIESQYRMSVCEVEGDPWSWVGVTYKSKEICVELLQNIMAEVKNNG